MERGPDLGEERIDFGALTIVPALALAFVTPVATLQHEPRARMELMTERTLEL